MQLSSLLELPGQAEQFREELVVFKGLLSTYYSEQHKDQATSIGKVVEDLTKLLVKEEDKKVPMIAFSDKFTTKTAQQIKTLRSDAKDKLDKLLQHDSPEGTQGNDDLAKKCAAVVEQAKHQSFKWGMARFVKQPEIKVQSKAGLKLRQNLKEMYNLNATDQKFIEYLGKDDQNIVLEILALDKKTTPAKQTKTAQDTIDADASQIAVAAG